MPTECGRDFFGFTPAKGREVAAAFDGGAITSDAGALLLGTTHRATGMMPRPGSYGAWQGHRLRQPLTHSRLHQGRRCIPLSRGVATPSDDMVGPD